jgi:hypothetical protein
VYKTFDVEVLDDFYSEGPRALSRGHDLLQASATEGLSLGFGQYEEEQEYQRRTTTEEFAGWITSAGGENAETVIRVGYEAAVELAQAQSLPIDTFFVTGASDEFELHVCEGTHQVTVLMFMPKDSEYGRTYGSSRAKAKSWIFRTGRPDDSDADRVDGGTVVQIQRSGRDGPVAS